MLRLDLVIALVVTAQAAPGVHLRFNTVGNHTQFHIGEAIPVTLDFEVEGAQSLQVDTDIRLRGIKPQGLEVFSAIPADGWWNPLARLSWISDGAYYNRPFATLDKLHPFHIERDLNEFIVFRKPGHYIIRVESTRVATQPANEIALDIMPRDDAWTKREFERAKAILDAGKPPEGGDRQFDDAKDNAQIDAVRQLRYLATAEATDYLASICGQERRSESEIDVALYASPYLEIAATRLEQRMLDHGIGMGETNRDVLFELKRLIWEERIGRPLLRGELDELDGSLNRELAGSTPKK